MPNSKVLVLTHKILNGLGPEYMKDHLHCYFPSHMLCSSEKVLLVAPSAKEVQLAGTQKKAFSVVTPPLNCGTLSLSSVMNLIFQASKGRAFSVGHLVTCYSPPPPGTVGLVSDEVLLVID